MPEYPWFSPYQFSGNRLIDAIELEGLEQSFELRFNRRNKSYLRGNISKEQLMDEWRAEAFGAIIGSTIVADFYIGKGKITKFATKQFGFQLAVNTATEGFVSVAFKEHKFEPKRVVAETFTNFDFADTGIDQGIKLLGKKYNLGKIQKALEIVAPSLFDITTKDGIQIVSLNKDSEKIILDIVGNSLTKKGEKLLQNTDIELPKVKLSSDLSAKIVSDIIIKNIKIQLVKDSQNKIKDNIKEDIRDDKKVKNDAIPKNNRRIKKDKLKES
ncbi:hypothetical protein [Flavobacterium sp. CS20]|uniref:hypothetical protein n=1 Tax=Flavobacterium sp. CS20 TaxID=2775246 RepID=UPI001B3A0FAF|nr:hypothetical protein [Flavobacterium sp. CS20]QTY27324.1 hypothetical protein IGB25_01710 [Flavobacterium sp. CS20]